MLTKNFHLEIRQPFATLFSSPCSVVNIAVDIRVLGHIIDAGYTNHCLVKPAKVYPKICVENVNRI